MINAFVTGQSLALSQPVVVANSIDYLEMRVIFQTAEWNGLSQWAHFKKKGDSTVYDVHLTDCMVRKEDHLNLTEGEWEVYLHGNSTEGTPRITTDVQTLTVKPTGFVCAPLPELPLSVTEQLDSRISALEAGGVGPGPGGTTDHSKLTNLDKADQHPIKAITGLQDALNNKQPKGNYATKDEIPSIPQVPSWAMQPNKPDYTASEVGALPAGTKIPGKTSELENDAGFLTEHQDLTPYAKKTDVPSTAAGLAAVVPPELVNGSEKNVQAILNYLAANTMLLGTKGRFKLDKDIVWADWVGFKGYEDVKVLGYGYKGDGIAFICGDPSMPLILKTKQPIKNEDGREIAMKDKTVALPDSGHGAAGQFAVSDGKGGIDWLTLVNRSEVGA